MVAARNEEARVHDTVAALAAIPGVSEVVVVDDRSGDGTARRASAAGATVIRARSGSGKGSAVEWALARLPPADVWLFVDADLGMSAASLAPVLEPVVAGKADLAIGSFEAGPGGGFGIVKRLAGLTIRALCGFLAKAPLSGQRAITGGCLAAVRPLASGFGMETGMTIDAVRAGFRVVEVPVNGVSHRSTGRGPRGFLHRGRQGIHVLRAAAARAIGLW